MTRTVEHRPNIGDIGSRHRRHPRTWVSFSDPRRRQQLKEREEHRIAVIRWETELLKTTARRLSFREKIDYAIGIAGPVAAYLMLGFSTTSMELRMPAVASALINIAAGCTSLWRGGQLVEVNERLRNLPRI